MNGTRPTRLDMRYDVDSLRIVDGTLYLILKSTSEFEIKKKKVKHKW